MNINIQIPAENNLKELKTFLLNYYIAHSAVSPGFDKEIGEYIAEILEKSAHE